MKRLSLMCLILIALLTVTVWHEAPTQAASRLTEDLADLFKSAELVVEAEVIDRQGGSIGTEGLPLTAVTLKVIHLYKGSGTDTGEIVRAEYLGGRNGEMQTIVPGQPNLAPGTRVVVLLSKFGRTPAWRVIGGDAGEIDFASGDDGLPLARRASGGKFDYFVKDAQSLTGFRAVSVSMLNEKQFQQLFEAIATTGRPVIENQVASTPSKSIQFAALEPKPTSVPARSEVAPVVPVTMTTSAAADSTTGFSLTQRLLVTLVLTSLAWIIGHRSIGSLRELRAKHRFEYIDWPLSFSDQKFALTWSPRGVQSVRALRDGPGMELTFASLSNLFSADAIIIGLIALLLFGKNLPMVARNVGRTIAEFKRAANEATSEIKREMDAAAHTAELNELKSSLRPDLSSMTSTQPSPPSPPNPDTATPAARPQPSHTVNYTPKPAAAKPPAVSAAAALDTFRIDVKPPTKIPPPIERA